LLCLYYKTFSVTFLIDIFPSCSGLIIDIGNQIDHKLSPARVASATKDKKLKGVGKLIFGHFKILKPNFEVLRKQLQSKMLAAKISKSSKKMT